MTTGKIILTLAFALVFATGPVARADLSQEQAYSLFSQANEAFRQANAATDDPDQAKKLYEKAILSYEKVITEGSIENARLYYNLANACLLKDDIGKAILNYRRAEKIDGSDANIRKNLTFARSQRIDKVAVKTEKQVLQTLFFWHYDFAIKTKFLLTCIFFAVVCIAVTLMIWFGRTAALSAITVICAILTVGFLSSVLVEVNIDAKKISGVITADQVIAHQGDGPNYPASFEAPLHAGTEFDLLESRPGWLNIRLSDSSSAWVPDHSADLI